MSAKMLSVTRRGFTMIYTALALVVLIGIVAFAVDLGRGHLAKSQLQAAADAGAYAGVLRIQHRDYSGTSTSARTVAKAVASKNAADVQANVDVQDGDVEFGFWNKFTRTFTVGPLDGVPTPNAVRVNARLRADRDTAVENHLAPAIGAGPSMDVSALAVGATFGGAFTGGGGMGLIGIQSVDIAGSATTDSYDPTLNPYDLNNRGDGGGIASNGDIKLSGGGNADVNVNGDLYWGPDSDDTVTATGHSTVSGESLQLEQPMVFPDPVVPSTNDNATLATGDTALYPWVTVNKKGKTTTLSISASSSTVIQLPPPGYTPGQTYVYELNEVSLSGQATLTIPADAKVVLYVHGQVQLTGGGVTNLSNKPEALKIYGLATIKSPKPEITLTGGAEAFAHVYAPNADVKIGGGGNNFGFFGAIIGKTLTIAGNTGVHYDGAQLFPPQTPQPYRTELVQ